MNQQEIIDSLKRTLADSQKVIDSLEAENAELKKKVEELEGEAGISYSGGKRIGAVPMTDNLKLREAVFRKMGAFKVKVPFFGEPVKKMFGEWEYQGQMYKELPPIESQWEVTAKYLVPFMRGKGYCYFILSQKHITEIDIKGKGPVFYWHKDGWKRGLKAEIINDNIALAACKAFMEVSLD